MPPTSRLAGQIEEVATLLATIDAPYAVIGGLAVVSHNVVRATQDVDLLVDSDVADRLDTEMNRLGYRCIHRSRDAANYLRADQRVDFLYAHRPIARRLLASATVVVTSMGKLRVIGVEGLIGLKLQALTNDPRRSRDLEDIRALLQANRDRLNLDELREYFRLFDKETWLDELLRESA